MHPHEYICDHCTCIQCKLFRETHVCVCLCGVCVCVCVRVCVCVCVCVCVKHYHAPPELIQLVTNIYDGLTAVVSTKSWTTAPIHLQLGVYQGAPLSAIIFNTVMNTLVDSIIQRYSQLGYSLNSAHSRINLLQYADDTCLIGDDPSSCQRLLSITESWLDCSGMQANVPKCVSVHIGYG